MPTPKKKERRAKDSKRLKKNVGKRKTVAKNTKEESKKRSKATKKTSKKIIAKKVSTKKTATIAKKSTSSKKVQRKISANMTPKKILKPKTSKWWSVLTFGVVAVAITVAGYLSLPPELLQNIQANIISQINEISGLGDPAEGIVKDNKTDEEGILLSWKAEGENEKKLRDIFTTVFPDISIRDIQYQTEEGQKFIQKFKVEEVPTILFQKEAFESESLSEVVKELFDLKDGYYELNVSLVNPSGQLRVNADINTDGAVFVGEEKSPLKAYIYSDPKCKYCRVNEQNNLTKFQDLADEGILELIFLDLPQGVESGYHTVALSCVGKNKPDKYMEFREKLFKKANLSKAYTEHRLSQIGLNYEEDCNAKETTKMIRRRMRTANQKEGVTGVPTIYMKKTGEKTAIRITGAKDFSEYQAVFDELLEKQ